jgi:DNA segregation ATPase FtsK/SpoIIIE-like protein
VLPVDELAELVEELPEAAALLDTIARKGRKTAITMLAATQRPTQDALGGGALRSQLTVRLCLRVTEPRDGELILGPGKAKLGYRPDLLDAPGKLLAWDPPDHTRPIPAKVYHQDRARIRAVIARAAECCPQLDPDTAAALTTRDGGEPSKGRDGTAPEGRTTPTQPVDPTKRATVPLGTQAGEVDPLAALLACLRAAHNGGGAKIAELAAVTGREKTWIYERLQELHRAGRVHRAGHGRWRLTNREEGGHDA